MAQTVPAAKDLPPIQCLLVHTSPSKFAEPAAAKERTQFFNKEVRVIAPRQQSDSPRVIDILIEDALHPGFLQVSSETPRIVGVPERQQLHKETAVRCLLHAAAHAAFFSDIEWFHHYSVRPRLRFLKKPLSHSFVTINGVVVGCGEPPSGSTVTAIAAALSIGPCCTKTAVASG